MRSARRATSINTHPGVTRMDCTKILAQLARLQARLPDPQPRTLLKAQRIDAEADAGRLSAAQWAELRRRADRLATQARRQPPRASRDIRVQQPGRNPALTRHDSENTR